MLSMIEDLHRVGCLYRTIARELNRLGTLPAVAIRMLDDIDKVTYSRADHNGLPFIHYQSDLP